MMFIGSEREAALRDRSCTQSTASMKRIGEEKFLTEYIPLSCRCKILFALDCRIQGHSLNGKNYYYYLSSCTEASDVSVLQSTFKATKRLYIEIDISSLRRSEPDIYTRLSCCNPGWHGFKISIFFCAS